tara:strand:+ start:493 stop:627 length:135 start_codon:yes stop_codon:yes gene_type:complete
MKNKIQKPSTLLGLNYSQAQIKLDFSQKPYRASQKYFIKNINYK